ncbi:MAG: mitochondrial fission ELM1 family protein, partial [Alphaproteobacteria bacterium]
PRLAHLPHPRVAVLIGGDNKAYRLTAEAADRLGRQLAALARDGGAGLMVTPSRRTGAENERILRDHLTGLPVEFWDGTGDNPYYAYLALADAIVATCDSVNMVSEACSTGKPVHVVALDGPGSAKFRRFHQALEADGLTRPFRGQLEQWTYPPLDDMTSLADEIGRRLIERRGD